MKVLAVWGALLVPTLCSSVHAQDIITANPRVQNGRLIITGTTAAPNMQLRLDGGTSAPFNVTSGASRAFTFNLVYLPSDCIATLQKVTRTALGAPSNWVVANCGAAGLSPRGNWSGSLFYLKNDLVTSQGSSWRAKRDNTNKPPAAGADWELFAQRGERGPRGLTGQQGPLGEQGPPGWDGRTGPVGPRGPAGPQGPQGEQGEVGPEGATGPAGPTGPQGAQGTQGPAGASGGLPGVRLVSQSCQ